MTDNKKKILIICEQSDIHLIMESFNHTDNYQISIETTEDILGRGVTNALKDIIQQINNNPDMYDGVVGTHDSSAVFASVICEHTGMPGISVEGVVNCQNKYISRQLQEKIVPEYIPNFCLDEEYLSNLEKSLPAFAKPVRSNVSFAAQKIDTTKDLQQLINDFGEYIKDYNQYYVDSLSLSSYDNPENLYTCNKFLCEELIFGTQVTADCYVYNQKAHVFALTKAAFFDDKISFSHHEFPYQVSPETEQKIYNMIDKLAKNLKLDNTFINVELKIDEKTGNVSIIEVNARIAFQFAKTIETVKGFDPLHLICDLASGDEPDIYPEFAPEYSMCYNFELRKFSDKLVTKIPDARNIARIKKIYPGVEIRNLILNGGKLSDYKHNPESYRYCILDIPGNNKEEIMDKLEDIKAMLNYRFMDIEETEYPLQGQSF
ncbi:conserved hypothetical protein [Methanohalobium evestigatum Z-7303]|uniref:ATP-grasp domain-containing protein n=1 Tax=Methanohalobium evestigatum (strain ATCC BAA-1072 / DSM 3721 / NBRC 107634 / OCM 161 / Z-7303) TaxID=644295 RepID=D7E9V2_METEZ|nr:ATP-grasp domain-containing protein [Methanohalobium evestigatum]ADI74374.1 conserved hypothetical protein [Methanohalobium evestigatum Z-7303]